MIKEVHIFIDKISDVEFDFAIDSITDNNEAPLKHEVVWALEKAKLIIIKSSLETPHQVKG